MTKLEQNPQQLQITVTKSPPTNHEINFRPFSIPPFAFPTNPSQPVQPIHHDKHPPNRRNCVITMQEGNFFDSLGQLIWKKLSLN
jgi:hypothetical protein